VPIEGIFERRDSEVDMRRKPLPLLLGFGLLLTGHLSLPAQDTKAVPVTIIVVDSAGAAIPHAQVELALQIATTTKNLETNEFGKTSLDVLPGNYHLIVNAPSFVHLSKNIEVEARSDQTVVVTLQIASATTTVQTCSPCFPIQTSPTPEQPIGLLSLPLQGRSTIEIGNVQVTRSLDATVHDTAGLAMPGVLVEEVTSDWKKSIRSTTTNAAGAFAFAPVKGRTVYYFQLSFYAYNPLRVRVKLDDKRGKELQLKMVPST
jgi:hypothetical protein